MGVDHRAYEYRLFFGRDLQIELAFVKFIVGCSLRLKQVILFEDLRQQALLNGLVAEKTIDNVLSYLHGGGPD